MSVSYYDIAHDAAAVACEHSPSLSEPPAHAVQAAVIALQKAPHRAPIETLRSLALNAARKSLLH